MRAIWMVAALWAALAPGAAQAERWRHRQSEIEIPDLPGGFDRGREIDNRRDGSDVIVQLGSDNEPVTLYVYRAAFPNPALWFERVRHAVNVNVDAKGTNVEPRVFTLGDSPAPNGLREEIALPPSANYRTSAVAIAQYGEWLVKVRITSRSLGVEQVRARMDRLLAAIRLPGPVPTPARLVIPGLCPASPRRLEALPLRDSGLAAQAAGGLRAVDELARGRGGLAVDADAWCRVTDLGLPSQYATLYRRRDDEAWVALFSDSGIAVVGIPIDLPDAAGGGSFVATSSMTGLVEIFNRMPAPELAIPNALPVLTGTREPVTRLAAGASR